MTKRPNSDATSSGREQRLRAALRENLARRKAQGRARAAKADLPQADAGQAQPEQGADQGFNLPENQEK